jgi:hypothetical protein
MNEDSSGKVQLNDAYQGQNQLEEDDEFYSQCRLMTKTLEVTNKELSGLRKEIKTFSRTYELVKWGYFSLGLGLGAALGIFTFVKCKDDFLDRFRKN